MLAQYIMHTSTFYLITVDKRIKYKMQLNQNFFYYISSTIIREINQSTPAIITKKKKKTIHIRKQILLLIKNHE